MPILAIQGSQWGDEGKGKITDFFAQKADVVVRSQGGNNAGHSIEFNSQRFALNLVPSGIFSKNTINVIANGVVVNLQALKNELDKLNSAGLKEYKLYISNRAHLLLPYHIDLDGANEQLLGENKIGTTKKGIGPCYSTKAERIGLRVGDLLLTVETLRKKVDGILKVINNQLKSYNLKEYTTEEIISYLESFKPFFKNMITDTSLLLENYIKEGKKILFEGAQGSMLCIEHGSYPYVTSSSPLANAIPLNAGIPPFYINNILGISKAYTTRVGEGPFPTELFNEDGNKIREAGHEYGTVTKRPRRVGYLDLVVLNHVKRISGMQHLALMLVDVLSCVKEIKICTSYTLDGQEINYIPSTLEEYERCIPNYITMPSFSEDISHITKYEDLPINCRNYIEKIEELVNIDVSIISVGPSREQTIIRKKIF